MLEGSVRKSGLKVRITGQLIDAASGTHLWADRFDGSLEDIFVLQDQVATSVVGLITPRVEQAEIERIKRKPTEKLDAYDLYLQALAELYRLSKASISEALRLFDLAIERDPRFALPYAMAARIVCIQAQNGWLEDTALEFRKGVQNARRSIELERDKPTVLATAGFAMRSASRARRRAPPPRAGPRPSRDRANRNGRSKATRRRRRNRRCSSNPAGRRTRCC